MTSFEKNLRKLCLILSLLAVFLLSGCSADPYGGRILENVTIGGLDVGGMTKSEARDALKVALEQTLYATDLTVKLPGSDQILSKDTVQPKVDIRKAVQAAYDFGREDSQNTSDISLLPYLEVNEEAIRQTLTDWAAECDTVLSQPSWTLEGDAPQLSTANFDTAAQPQTLLVTLGIPETHMEVSQVYAEILTAFDEAIPACRSGSFTVIPEIAPEKLPDSPDLDAIFQELSVEAADDSLSLETYQMVYGSYGYGFDLENAKKLVESAAYGETVSISMEFTAPEILGEGVYFRDVLGVCETPHNSNEKRNTNLRLVCEILDGFILQPGEEFSYNGVIGERTEERGFQSAPAYSGDRLIQDIGGGVCQGSSTLYNCALLADLQITERVCHGFTVNYLPIGLDAAVNWNTKTDLKFVNSTHFPIMIQAEVSDGYMKMKMLGTDEKDYYIEMRSSRFEDDYRIYSKSYKFKYDKKTNELLSKDMEALSAYMFYNG